MLHCELPLNEILVDFNDKIKSITRGYGSMDYEHAGYRAAKLVKLDLLVNGEPVDAFSMHRPSRRAEAGPATGGEAQGSHPAASSTRWRFRRRLAEKSSPAKVFRPAQRRDREVYGGDITRKRKLLEKQKEGKKRMKRSARSTFPRKLHRGAEDAVAGRCRLASAGRPIKFDRGLRNHPATEVSLSRPQAPFDSRARGASVWRTRPARRRR